MNPEIPHYQIALNIDEILSSGISNSAYRVLGTISNYDIHHNLAILSQPGSLSSLLIDTTLLLKFSFKESSVYEFFGELYDRVLPPGFEGLAGVRSNIILRPIFKRNLDGVDLELYEQVEALRRKMINV
jgi:hypothetical protein